MILNCSGPAERLNQEKGDAGSLSGKPPARGSMKDQFATFFS
jgi:hypothetical protein